MSSPSHVQHSRVDAWLDRRPAPGQALNIQSECTTGRLNKWKPKLVLIMMIVLLIISIMSNINAPFICSAPSFNSTRYIFSSPRFIISVNTTVRTIHKLQFLYCKVHGFVISVNAAFSMLAFRFQFSICLAYWKVVLLHSGYCIK